SSALIAIGGKMFAERAKQRIPGKLRLWHMMTLDDLSRTIQVDAFVGRHAEMRHVVAADLAQHGEYLLLGDEPGASPFKAMNGTFADADVEAGTMQQGRRKDPPIEPPTMRMRRGMAVPSCRQGQPRPLQRARPCVSYFATKA